MGYPQSKSEVASRAIQMIASNIIFDAPFLVPVRMRMYGLIGEIGENTVFARSVMFIRPHRQQGGFFGIGSNVGINHHAELDFSGGLIIEDHVWISQYVIIETHEHLVRDRSLKKDQPIRLAPLRICRDAWIGAFAVILPGVSRIGEGAVIGAGAVVTRDVEDWSVVGGIPAKKIGER